MRRTWPKVSDVDVMAEFLFLFDEHQVPPSIREVQEMAGLSSTSVTVSALERLEGKGWLKMVRSRGNARNYLPTPNGRRAVTRGRND